MTMHTHEGSRTRGSNHTTKVRSLLAGVGVILLIATGLTGCDTSPVRITGHVTVAGTSTGAGTVAVEIYSDDDPALVTQAPTDTSGAYTVQGSSLAPGTYRLRIGGQWYGGTDWDTATPVTVVEGAPMIVDATVPATSTMTGVVALDGTPQIGIQVIAVTDGPGGTRGTAETMTGADGTWTLPLAMTGTVRLVLRDPSGTWPIMWVGGTDDPASFPVHPGTTEVPTLDLATGVGYAPDTTWMASLATDGSQGDDNVTGAMISSNGRYVTFATSATDLVADDTNDAADIFTRDTLTGETTRVSVASDGTQGDGDSYTPSISDDGRWVSFESDATDLVADDTNDTTDIFLHDTLTGETTRVSVADDGTQGDDSSYAAVIAADGGRIAFTSNATNLVPDDTNNASDVFVYDIGTASVIRASIAGDGTEGDGNSYTPSLSANGRHVGFDSDATNLVPDDTNGHLDVFVHDMVTGVTTRVSVATDGTEADDSSDWSTLSADGRLVAYSSDATNLVAGDTNGRQDVFVHNMVTGVTTRVSIATDGTEADRDCKNAWISADGRHVVFTTRSSTLDPDDTNDSTDAYVRDLPPVSTVLGG